jgi:hypothetical protein
MRKTLTTIAALTMLLLTVASPAQASGADSFSTADTVIESGEDVSIDGVDGESVDGSVDEKGDTEFVTYTEYDKSTPKLAPEGDTADPIDTGASRCLIVIVC